MTEQQKIDNFLSGAPHAVAGASSNRSKYGNKVLRAYMQRERPVYPLNPNASKVEGLPAYGEVSELPKQVHGLSIVTPPHVTEVIVDRALKAGIQHLWMQPGAESNAAVERAESAGANVIAHGPCLLVALRFRETSE